MRERNYAHPVQIGLRNCVIFCEYFQMGFRGENTHTCGKGKLTELQFEKLKVCIPPTVVFL